MSDLLLPDNLFESSFQSILSAHKDVLFKNVGQLDFTRNGEYIDNKKALIELGINDVGISRGFIMCRLGLIVNDVTQSIIPFHINPKDNFDIRTAVGVFNSQPPNTKMFIFSREVTDNEETYSLHTLRLSMEQQYKNRISNFINKNIPENYRINYHEIPTNGSYSVVINKGFLSFWSESRENNEDNKIIQTFRIF